MKFFIASICVIINVSVLAQADILHRVFTLEQCITIALQNNRDVQNLALTVLSTEVDVEQAKRNRLPYVSGNIVHGLNQGRSINPYDNSYVNQNLTSANYIINAGLSLWNGFKLKNYLRQTTLDLEAAKKDLQQKKDNITIQVILAYMDVLNREEQLKAAATQKTTIDSQYHRLEVLDKNGAASPSDLYNIKGEVSDNDIAVLNIQNSLEQAKILLFEIMNMPYNSNVVLQGTNHEISHKLYPQSAAEVYEASLQTMGMIKAAELNRSAANAAIKVAVADRYPLLSLNAGIGSNYSSAAYANMLNGASEIETNNYINMNGIKYPVYTVQQNYIQNKIGYLNQLKNNYGTGLSLNLSIPVFNSIQAKSKIRKAEINFQQADVQLQYIKTQLNNTINRAYADMLAAYNIWTAQYTKTEAYKEFYRVSLVKFEAGAINSVDFLNAKNKLDQASIQLIAAKYDYLFKTRILDYYSGIHTFN